MAEKRQNRTEYAGFQDGENLDEAAVTDYVKRHIKMRLCNTYIPYGDNGSDNCACGRAQDWHQARGLPTRSDVSWDSVEHADTLPSNSFGTVHFQGYGPGSSTNSPYIRIDQETNPEDIWPLVHKLWNLPKPRLLISVTGGAKRFFLKGRLKDKFKRSLVKVAISTGAWIMDGGTQAGVRALVGEAVRDYNLTATATDPKVIAIGVAAWSIIDNKQALESPNKHTGCFPAYYNASDLSPKGTRFICSLDPYHTHFILVDNGHYRFQSWMKNTQHSKFKVNFERFLSNMSTTVAKNQSVTVPVVRVILEGGTGAFQAAHDALAQDVPVVIISGSGRCADIIGFAYKMFNNSPDEEVQFMPENPDGSSPNKGAFDAIYEKMATLLDWSREQNDPDKKNKMILACMDYLEKLLKMRDLLTVFFMDDVDTNNDIDQAILFALLKAKKSEFVQQLNLTLAWNQCDIARQVVFKNESRQEWQSRMDILHNAMFTALVNNWVDFVQLFLDNGVELKNFLTVRRLHDLYKEIVNDPTSGTSSHLLLQLLQRQQLVGWGGCGRHVTWDVNLPDLLLIVGRLVNELAGGDRFRSLYQDKKYHVDEDSYGVNKSQASIQSAASSQVRDQNGHLGEKSVAQKLQYQGHCHLLPPEQHSPGHKYRSDALLTEKHEVQEPEFTNPERELLFWAVLLNREELAQMFWKRGTDHIGGAQTASAIFRSLAEVANREEEIDLSNQLQNNSIEFEDIAVGVLNECYHQNKAIAHNALSRNLTDWGNTTVLSIADNAQQMSLMGHSCCQTKLNKIWMGKMALYTSIWKIFFGLVLFPFIIPSIRFIANTFDEISTYRVKKHDSLKMQKNQIGPVSGKMKRQMSHTTQTTQLYKVGLTNDSDKEKVNYFKALVFFHMTPLVKFFYHTFSYLMFMGIYCFFVLTDLRHLDAGGPSVYEYIVWGWATTMLIEEIRQIITQEPSSIGSKFSSYFSGVWNKFDVCVYLLLIISIILRYTLPYDHFAWVRRFYIMTLILFFMRFVQTFYVNKNMGPKIIMIRKMLKDLVFFVIILAVFVFGYGVAIQALQHPNALPSWTMLRDVVYMPYFQLYGELFLDDIEGDSDTCSASSPLNPDCPEKSWLVFVLLAIYMIFTNVLLLNLLIAMFSHTFATVQENSEKVWRFYRYGLIYEYFDKPTLAPPLIILNHIFRFIKYINRRCCGQTKVDSDFFHKLSHSEDLRMTAFEKAGMENFLLHAQEKTQQHIETKVTTMGQKVDKAMADLDLIRETFTNADTNTPSLKALAHRQSSGLNTNIAKYVTTSKGAGDGQDRSGVNEAVTSLKSEISDLHDALKAQVKHQEENSQIIRDLVQTLQTQPDNQSHKKDKFHRNIHSLQDQMNHQNKQMAEILSFLQHNKAEIPHTARDVSQNAFADSSYMREGSLSQRDGFISRDPLVLQEGYTSRPQSRFGLVSGIPQPQIEIQEN